MIIFIYFCIGIAHLGCRRWDPAKTGVDLISELENIADKAATLDTKGPNGIVC